MNESEEKFTPLTLAQHILSKSNLEKLFDALSKKPSLVANGCDFLITILDLLSRSLPAPLCISLTTNDESISSNKIENERMQVREKAKNIQTKKLEKSRFDFFIYRSMMKEMLYR